MEEYRPHSFLERGRVDPRLGLSYFVMINEILPNLKIKR